MLDILVANGVRLDLAETHRAGHAEALAREAARQGEKLVAAAALAFGRTRTLWPSQANGADSARLFVQMLGVGFDAQVVNALRFPLKKAFGKSAYVMQSMRELTRYKFPMIQMRVDDIETEAASAIISKGRLYGGNFRLAAGAMPNEPGFRSSCLTARAPLPP